MKYSADKLENVRARLEVFKRIENKATDEIGWIALAYSISRSAATELVDAAYADALEREEVEKP